MRRSTVVVCLLLTQASFAWAQSAVETTAESQNPRATTPQPTPAHELHDAPSTPDSRAIHSTTPAEKSELPALRPAMPDTDNVSGHWFLGVAATIGTPLGNFTSQSPLGERLGESYTVGADLGLGVTRNVVVSVAGDFGSVASGSACETCEAQSYSIGPRLRYHLVEGTRFSPWLGYGLSYRHTKYSDGATSYAFGAFEPVRFELGGDWYVTSKLTVGPLLSLGIDRNVKSDDGNSSDRWSTWLAGGLRFAFDSVGR